ncbi:MAG: hypothetical protein HC769_06035 [Cyanobacteria bacterium CRU_2_1]|nr:hypothetical protein [Cyanobacteria bacterium RU_5_0]NJR58448.1 hypothetical protein [Cyanobacteria bacterium CRU_2_1]
MSILPNLLRSLLLTSIFSFLVPVVLIGIILISLIAVGYVPKLELISKAGIEHVSYFLLVFGSGSVVQGVVTIGSVGSLVGILFDTYTFYRHQNLRDQK